MTYQRFNKIMSYVTAGFVGAAAMLLVSVTSEGFQAASEARQHRRLVMQSCVDTGRSLFLCEAILAGKVSPAEKGP